VPRADPVWTLERFEQEFDAWCAREYLSDELRIRVLLWIQSRMDDPYRGVSRDQSFENLWFGAIPGTDRPDSRAATGSYFVFESTRVVRCNSFSILQRPI
jgi:hypothetical protein